VEPDLCLLSVHAHPDDEASKGASTVARYSAEGVRSVLVTCTGGEAGDILNEKADTPEVRADLPAVRIAELRESVSIIGYHALHLLGYRDSGMPDTEANAHPDCFANADLDEAVGRLVAIIRAERPQVVLTYGEDHSRYPHPDHIRVHEITVPAFDRAGDPGWYPDAGEPWQPLKLYYMGGFSRRRIEAMHTYFVEQGEESPYTAWLERLPADEADPHTTSIDVGDFIEHGRRALMAHRTQIDPDGRWFRIPTEVIREVHPWEHYVLARSLVGDREVEGIAEDDLFAGIRATADTRP
jgi:mycothiol S-conjugate amidase